MRKLVLFQTLCLAATLSILPAVANAESYSSLMKKGFKTGKLSASKSGSLGWIVQNGGKKYFCRMSVSTVYVGKSEMASFTASGRMIAIDRATFEKSIGGYDPSIPQLSDIKAGRLKAEHVGACSAL